MQQSWDTKPTESPDDLGQHMAQHNVFGQPRHVSVSRVVCVIFSHHRGDH